MSDAQALQSGPKLFPAIDLRGGQVVRLTQGDYDRQTTYHDDPVAQAKLFEEAGATWLHVVDLDGARSGQPTNHRIIQDICRQTSLLVEVGGGVRSQATIDTLLSAGVTRCVLGTAALKQWDWFRETVHHPDYRDKLVLGLDAKDGEVAVAGWEEGSGQQAIDLATEASDWPLAAIVYTDIAVDGMLTGPNVEQTRALAEATQVPVVASGGVGTLQHLDALRTLPVQGAIVGKALYDGRFTIDEALRTLEGA